MLNSLIQLQKQIKNGVNFEHTERRINKVRTCGAVTYLFTAFLIACLHLLRNLLLLVDTASS
jgi:Zn-dependent membrane protease YugP